jgi:hypothetical protein
MTKCGLSTLCRSVSAASTLFKAADDNFESQVPALMRMFGAAKRLEKAAYLFLSSCP